MGEEAKKTINFIKMHGLGNDFVLIDARQADLPALDFPGFAREVCDRNFGVGADGLILVLPSDKADFKMRIFNSDGSEAETCGNGLRCFAKYVYESSPEKKDVISVETKAGISALGIVAEEGKVKAVEVDMGEPRFLRDEKIDVNGKKFKASCVSMGNPHCVIFVDNVADAPVEEVGPKIENLPIFPERTNVEFVQVLNNQEAKVRVWERGVGETLACGSGACATVVAGVLKELLKRRTVVHLPGGELEIEWSEKENHVLITGPAATVFKGEYYL